MKEYLKFYIIVFITIIGCNILSAQNINESFENGFYPAGWSGKGFQKTNARQKTGRYSALSSHNNNKPEDNYLKINSVSIGLSGTITISFTPHNGNKGTNIEVFIKNSSKSKGDSVLIGTFNSEKNTWKTSYAYIPMEYWNTQNTSIYFIPKKVENGNDKIYIDDISTNSALPVEMESFNFNVSENNVNLKWKTVSEINNKGFEIQRSSNGNWQAIGFVNANSTKVYSYSDNNLQAGSYQYRLKQIDYNGDFEYYNLNSTVKVGNPAKYSLSQNFPNPFNPSTKINFQIPNDDNVTLKIYDNTGKEVMTLVNEYKTAGYHTVEMKSGNLSSGIYFYHLIAGNFSETRKMTILK